MNVHLTIVPKMAKIIHCPRTMSHAEVSVFIEGMKRHAPWHTPIFQSLLVGDIAVCIPLPGQSLPIKDMDRLSKPLIVMICDDGPVCGGPEDWSCANRTFRWAAGGVLHGTGGEPAHYRLALAGAKACRRFVIVDTSSDYLPAWEKAAKRHMANRQVVCFRVTPGLSHPTPDVADHV